jgi:hypothetical protein
VPGPWLTGRLNRWRLARSRADVLVLGSSLRTVLDVILDVILDGDDLEQLEVGRLSELESGG